jgi:hypothetical protein
MVTMGQNFLYTVWTDKLRKKRGLIMPVENVIAEVTKKHVYRWKKTVALDVDGEKDGVDYLVPLVRYRFARNN